MFSVLKDMMLPSLPAGKNIVRVFADFLGYLMACTEKYIKETYATMTEDIWSTLRDDMVVVLAHPNGWGGAQQQQMRRSAILAKIIPDTPDGHDRVSFVTEGEASLHYCIQGKFIDDVRETPFRQCLYSLRFICALQIVDKTRIRCCRFRGRHARLQRL